MAGVGTADVYYRLGSAAGFEDDASGWMLAGSASMLANVTGDMSNIPVSINVNAGETVSIYVHGVGVNCLFGSGVDSTYNAIVSSDANLSIVSGFAKRKFKFCLQETNSSTILPFLSILVLA